MLNRKRKKFCSKNISFLLEIEDKIWSEWTDEERKQYLTLTQKYRDLYFGVGEFKEVYKQIKKIYNVQTGYKLGIFHLESATAEFRTMSGIKESIQLTKKTTIKMAIRFRIAILQ